MKAVLEKVEPSPDMCFCYQIREHQQLKFNWHYHPEYEIALNIKGRGQRFVGDDISTYQDMDLVLFGPNLPHAFVSDVPLPEDAFASIIIQFREEAMGLENLRRPEFRAVRRLFRQAGRGVGFSLSTVEGVLGKMQKLQTSTGMEAWIGLLSIMDDLARAGIQASLSSEGFVPSLTDEEPPLVDRVYNYIFQHCAEGISLSEAAAAANLSVPAFCRFFKRSSGKTFVEYLNTVRVGAACKLLIQTNLQISDICYRAGFNNLSNFNRRFMTARSMSPRAYRRLYNRP